MSSDTPAKNWFGITNFKPLARMTNDDARLFLALVSADPTAYVTDLLHAHYAALADAQVTLTDRSWTRGEVQGFCAACEVLPDVHAHRDCRQWLAWALSGVLAEPYLEAPGTWDDRCTQIHNDRDLCIALVTVWRAWRLNKTGPVAQWIANMPRVSARPAATTQP